MVDPRHSRQASMSRAPLEDVNTNGADIGPRTGTSLPFGSILANLAR